MRDHPPDAAGSPAGRPRDPRATVVRASRVESGAGGRPIHGDRVLGSRANDPAAQCPHARQLSPAPTLASGRMSEVLRSTRQSSQCFAAPFNTQPSYRSSHPLRTSPSTRAPGASVSLPRVVITAPPPASPTVPQT
jgi:hypothetical protein